MKARIIFAALLIGALFCPAASEKSESLRVWRVYPDTFDLTLTAVFRFDGVNLKASINHRSGKTYFVSSGDIVGPYRVEKLTRTGRYDGTALLREVASGDTYTLNVDESLRVPGYRAQIADMTTSAIWDVRKKDPIPGNGLTISEIAEDAVTAVSTSNTVVIPSITEAERSALKDTWKKIQAARIADAMEKKKAAEEKRQKEVAAAAAARAALAKRQQDALNIEIRTAPKIFFGTEYRYPSEYEYFYTLQNGPGGTTPRVIAIPTAFETRNVGWGFTVQP